MPMHTHGSKPKAGHVPKTAVFPARHPQLTSSSARRTRANFLPGQLLLHSRPLHHITNSLQLVTPQFGGQSHRQADASRLLFMSRARNPSRPALCGRSPPLAGPGSTVDPGWSRGSQGSTPVKRCSAEPPLHVALRDVSVTTYTLMEALNPALQLRNREPESCSLRQCAIDRRPLPLPAANSRVLGPALRVDYDFQNASTAFIRRRFSVVT